MNMNKFILWNENSIASNYFGFQYVTKMNGDLLCWAVYEWIGDISAFI